MHLWNLGKETKIEIPPLPTLKAQGMGGHHSNEINAGNHKLFEEVPSLGIPADVVMAVASNPDSPEPNIRIGKPGGSLFTENLTGNIRNIGPRRAEIRQKIAGQGITATQSPEFVADTTDKRK
jgi:hypothetical protein